LSGRPENLLESNLYPEYKGRVVTADVTAAARATTHRLPLLKKPMSTR
jgi:hypothetical protein